MAEAPSSRSLKLELDCRQPISQSEKEIGSTRSRVENKWTAGPDGQWRRPTRGRRCSSHRRGSWRRSAPSSCSSPSPPSGASITSARYVRPELELLLVFSAATSYVTDWLWCRWADESFTDSGVLGPACMQTLKKNHQRPLYEALLKVKEGNYTPRKEKVFLCVLLALATYSETYDDASSSMIWALLLFCVLVCIVAELMLLGFISLLLTVLQGTIQRTCIPPSWTNYMLPCQRPGQGHDEAPAAAAMAARLVAADILGGISRARMLREAGAEAGLCEMKVKWWTDWIIIMRLI